MKLTLTEGAPPQEAIDAVIAAVLLRDYRHCDMAPVVVDWAKGPTDPKYCPNDVWWIAVQYSSKGYRAAFGVDRNNVPQCYAD